MQPGNYPQSLTVMFNLASEQKMDTDFRINHTKYFVLKTGDHKFITRQIYAKKKKEKAVALARIALETTEIFSLSNATTCPLRLRDRIVTRF